MILRRRRKKRRRRRRRRREGGEEVSCEDLLGVCCKRLLNTEWPKSELSDNTAVVILTAVHINAIHLYKGIAALKYTSNMEDLVWNTFCKFRE
jgi:hypothetical protein